MKGLFHGHKEGSQGSGAAPQQPQSLARAGERELPFAGEFDFCHPEKTHTGLWLTLSLTSFVTKPSALYTLDKAQQVTSVAAAGL